MHEISRKITLTMQRWKVLSERIDTITECFDDICKKKITEMFQHLGGGVHVKLDSPYRVVHIRKYYLSKEDQFFPTSTGVAMRYDEYRDLKAAMNTINSTLKLETISSCWNTSLLDHADKSCKECYPYQKSDNKRFVQNLILK
jgi:hypothetical protein